MPIDNQERSVQSPNKSLINNPKINNESLIDNRKISNQVR